jgi:hypothetical protein
MVDSSPTTPSQPAGELPEKANSPEIDQQKAANSELQTALAIRSKTLEKLVERILGKVGARERARFCRVISMTCDGIPWRQIERETKTGWMEMTALQGGKPMFNALWKAARQAGEDLRRELRESEAHRRAVDGWDEPVFWKGKQTGLIRKFDSKLLEMMLKADNPERYAEHQEIKHTGGGAEVGGITVNFIGVEFGEQPKYVPPAPPVRVPVTLDLPPSTHKDPLPIVNPRGNGEVIPAEVPQPKPTKPRKGGKQ